MLGNLATSKTLGIAIFRLTNEIQEETKKKRERNEERKRERKRTKNKVGPPIGIGTYALKCNILENF